MSDFVGLCRREWRRLGVPADAVEDMASELEADLRDAGSDGVSAQDLLGSDPRAFAAAWAAERGVVPSQRSRFGLSGRSRVLVPAAALFSAAAIAAATALLVSPASRSSAVPLPPRGTGTEIAVTPTSASASAWAAATYTYIAPNGTVYGQPLLSGADDSREAAAWSLLIAGLVALALLLLYRRRAAAQVRRVTS